MRLRSWGAKIIRFFFRVHVSGLENIPAGGCIVCANHTGYPDALVLAAAFPRQLHFLAKEELFHVPLLAPFARAMGAVSVTRDSADVGAIKKAVSLTQDGDMVAIFPQGHRFRGKNPAETPIKYGIGMMAYRSGAPVLPVCLKMKKQRYCLFRRVDVIIGVPISYADICGCESGREGYEHAANVFFANTCRLGGYIPPRLGAPAQITPEVNNA